MLFMCSKHLQSGKFVLSFWALVARALAPLSICSTTGQRIFDILIMLCRFVASSTTAGDTSEPTDTLGSTETAGTGTPSTIGDVTATSESTIGGKKCVI